MKTPKTLLFLFSLFILLNILDIISTHILLGLGGYETNPFWPFSELNVYGVTPLAIFVKLGSSIGYCFLINYGHKRAIMENSNLARAIFYGLLVFSVVWYFGILFNNTFFILEALAVA